MYHCRYQRIPNGLVQKKLIAHDAYSERLITHMLGDNPREAVCNYIDSLCKAGVTLPSQFSIEADNGIVVVHEWIEGATLDDVFYQSPTDYLNVVRRIGDWQFTLQEHQLDACLDVNLHNFVVRPEGPVLIDVLPPLIVSQAYKPQDPYETMLLSLCLCHKIKITALFGYILKPFLISAHRSIIGQMQDLADHWEVACVPPLSNRTPHDLFSARLSLALTALKDLIELEQALKFYEITSLRKLMNLSKHEQDQQIKQAWSFYDRIAC